MSASNPPAFPVTLVKDASGNIEYPGAYFPDVCGMDLRDYFAAKALQGAVSNGALERICSEVANEGTGLTLHEAAKVTNNVLARMMYDIADAMLAQREKGTK